MQSILYYREGGSDKVYQVAVVETTGGYHVQFAYGRRDSTLQSGRKTSKPVARAEAERIATKLVSSKLAKGYTPATDGTPYQMAGEAGRDSGIRCQLLNAVEEFGVPWLLRNSRHILQEKMDGKRMMVRKQGREVTGINRRGLVVDLARPVMEAALLLPVDFIIDGEAVGDVLHAFDLLEVAGQDVRDRAYLDRFTGLLRIIDQSGAIRPVSTVIDPEEKQAAFNRLLSAGAEGVVFKDRDALFAPGRPASGGSQLKFKFVTTASFVVEAINKRRSVSLVLLNGNARVSAGNVTIPPDHKIPKPGEVVEVRYLYAFRESGCIYQPVYQGTRNDVDAGDCQVEQLKFKSESVAASAL